MEKTEKTVFDKQDDAIKLRKQGFSFATIASQVEMSIDWVKAVIDKNNICCIKKGNP